VDTLLIDTSAPENFTMIAYRQCLKCARSRQGLLLFVGHHSILAWALPVGMGIGKLSDEGVTIRA